MRDGVHDRARWFRRLLGSTGSTSLDPVVRQRKESPVRTFLFLAGVAFLLALLLKTFVLDAFRIPTASMENTILAGDFLLVNKIAYGAHTPDVIPFTDIHIPSTRLPGLTRPRRGEVLVFQYPDTSNLSPHVHYVKRCIALPGDTVAIVDGRVLVNGVETQTPESARIEHPPARYTFGPVVVPGKGDLVDLSPASIERWRTLMAWEGHNTGMNERGEVLINGLPQSSIRLENNYYFVLGDNRGDSFDSRSWGFLPENLIVGRAMLVYWSRDERAGGTSFLARLVSIRWGRLGTLIH